MTCDLQAQPAFQFVHDLLWCQRPIELAGCADLPSNYLRQCSSIRAEGGTSTLSSRINSPFGVAQDYCLVDFCLVTRTR
jgi:hypothetical protein